MNRDPVISAVITADGSVKFIDDDALAELKSEGTPTVQRASHVEPSADGRSWIVDTAPIGGPVYSGFHLRAGALEFERFVVGWWLETGKVVGLG
jgi:hypothetical protein